VRPDLSTHPSHAGFLTLTSPEINAETQPVTTATDDIPALSSTNIPQIIEPGSSPTEAPERIASPVEKLKGAFTLPRKKSSETVSSKATSGGQGAFGGLFKTSSRRESVAEPEEIADSQQTEGVNGEVPAPNNETQETKEERPTTPARGRPRINTASLPHTPPNLTDTPTTFVTPPTPTDHNTSASTFPRKTPKTSNTPSPSNSIKHRRVQSANTSSKLSQSILPPLTPFAEEYKTPGGTLTTQQAAGFFTSFFSAAQKAAGQLSNTINNSGPDQKDKALPPGQTAPEGGEEVIPGVESQAEGTDETTLKRRSAIETLGKGDLNFSHLGIRDEASPMSSQTDLALQNGESTLNNDAGKKQEQEAAARAVSQAYENKPIAVTASHAPVGRPLSITSNDRLTLTGDQSPPRAGTEVDGIKRSGSVRSKLSGRRRRKRNSSATAGTVNSIGAGLAAVGTGLSTANLSGPGHRLTGFAVASSKRNKDFHQLFRSVPEDDYLIEDYSAALQRDILLHGRLYVSEGHICFSSNILGWVTNLVISFDEVVSVEKKSTAVIFPNAIVISTLHARNTFASFVARDSTYELLIGIWKISHPNLKSSLNGVTLDNAGTGDKTEVADPDGSVGDSEDDSEDEIYDEDDDDDVGSFTDAGLAPSIVGSEVGDQVLSRKASAALLGGGASQANGAGPKGLENADVAVTGAGVSADHPGPLTHEPTQCSDEHYDRPITDVTIPAPLGKVYSMMYGPAANVFMRKWLVDDQKSRELNLPDDKNGLDNDHKTMVFDYIKPLSGAVGPKQTKCITTNTLTAFDLEKVVTVDCSTQTPDVPSGNVFTTKTRYCLTWGPGNSTRMVANCTIEWTGKSWLKGRLHYTQRKQTCN